MSSAAIVWAWRAPVDSCQERCLLLALAEYHHLESADRIYPSVATLAKMTNMSPRSVHNCLARLEHAGLLRRKHRFGKDGEQRSSIYFLVGVQQLTPPARRADPPCTSDTPPLQELQTESLTVNPGRESKGASSRMKRPTVEEIREYCQERGNQIDPEEFWAFYESKGWKVGKAPMKSWKACIITWEKSHAKDGSKKGPGGARQDDGLTARQRRNLEAIERLDRSARQGGY